ncbi:hypothetical protein DPMN_182197 [Dreissena polymorpha]|uniref:Uncharacterized protein n=1 Tax=Dreissena polymorpha TaxID=45954 RepID=A0A9D4DDQ5_DREPO|nr:hypothetical protein DPMN_182197 [Dreissena polymorpha]
MNQWSPGRTGNDRRGTGNNRVCTGDNRDRPRQSYGEPGECRQSSGIATLHK